MAPIPYCTRCGTRCEGVFCSSCGAVVQGGSSRPRDRRAWAIAWLVAAAAVGAVVVGVARNRPDTMTPDMANAGNAGPGSVPLPDLSALSPEERFATLFDRVMRAGTDWDSATVASLSPLAVAAYAALDSVDADARFHAGLIAIQIGNFPGAHALADTLERRDPGHLFGPILLGALARLEGDTAGYRQALDWIRERAPEELGRSDRPEYVEHRQLLTEVQQAAETQ
jgi:hypothetical protein